MRHLHVLVEELLEERLVRVGGGGQLAQPALDERHEAEDAGFEVHHAAARHGGRRGHRQVRHLEHHRHVLRVTNEFDYRLIVLKKYGMSRKSWI